jgi:hypothetical protein
MSKLTCCCALALSLTLLACGERQPPLLDGALGGDGALDGAFDGSSLNDAASEQTPADATPSPGLYIALKIETFFANCMPSVPPDPITLKGHAELLNNGTLNVGPLQLSAGTILSATGAVAGTFNVKSSTSTVVKPGEGLSVPIEKVPGSLQNAAACGMCGKSVRIRLAYAGVGIPTGAKVTSVAVTLSCAY